MLEVEILGRYTIYADETVPELSSDLLTALGFIGIAGMAALGAGLAAAARRPDDRLCTFFLLVVAGATFLAFDEQFELVDSLGYNVEALYLPDAILYGPPVALFAFAFRRILTASRTALYLLVAGAALFGVAQGIDRLPHDRFEGMEEKLEAVAVAPLGLGLAVLSIHHLRAGADYGTPRIRANETSL